MFKQLALLTIFHILNASSPQEPSPNLLSPSQQLIGRINTFNSNPYQTITQQMSDRDNIYTYADSPTYPTPSQRRIFVPPPLANPFYNLYPRYIYSGVDYNYQDIPNDPSIMLLPQMNYQTAKINRVSGITSMPNTANPPQYPKKPIQPQQPQDSNKKLNIRNIPSDYSLTNQKQSPSYIPQKPIRFDMPTILPQFRK